MLLLRDVSLTHCLTAGVAAACSNLLQCLAVLTVTKILLKLTLSLALARSRAITELAPGRFVLYP